MRDIDFCQAGSLEELFGLEDEGIDILMPAAAQNFVKGQPTTARAAIPACMRCVGHCYHPATRPTISSCCTMSASTGPAQGRFEEFLKGPNP